MFHAIFWWVGFFVCVAIARKLIVALIARHKEFCFWTTTVAESLAPIKSANLTHQTGLPWIVLNIPRRSPLMDEMAKRVSQRWPLHPVVLLTTSKEAAEALAALVDDENSSKGRSGGRVCESIVLDHFGPVSTMEDAVKDKVVGLLLSCLEPSPVSKEAEDWTAEEIKHEIWTTMRGHMMLTRLCLPNMIKRQVGTVVAFCSEMPELSIPSRSIQSSVAHGLMIFAKALQTESRSKNILIQTWLYHKFGEIKHMPMVENYLRETNSVDLCCDRCLSCLETGTTSWIFPFGYTPSVIRPCLRQEILANLACLVPAHILTALRHSSLPIF